MSQIVFLSIQSDAISWYVVIVRFFMNCEDLSKIMFIFPIRLLNQTPLGYGQFSYDEKPNVRDYSCGHANSTIYITGEGIFLVPDLDSAGRKTSKNSLN